MKEELAVEENAYEMDEDEMMNEESIPINLCDSKLEMVP